MPLSASLGWKTRGLWKKKEVTSCAPYCSGCAFTLPRRPEHHWKHSLQRHGKGEAGDVFPGERAPRHPSTMGAITAHSPWVFHISPNSSWVLPSAPAHAKTQALRCLGAERQLSSNPPRSSCSPLTDEARVWSLEKRHFEENRANPKAGLRMWITIPTFSSASSKVVHSSVERRVSCAGQDEFPQVPDGTGQYVHSSQGSEHCHLPT